eukprot:4872939-Prorocentrum_lima.AAC.1
MPSRFLQHQLLIIVPPTKKADNKKILDLDCGESDQESQTSISASSTIQPTPSPTGVVLRVNPHPNPLISNTKKSLRRTT